MKKILLIFVCCNLLFSSCQHQEEEKECCQKPGKEEKPDFDPAVTLFDVNSVWTTQDNEKVQFKGIKGKAIVAAMIFTHCQSACPRITADLQRIEKVIPADKLQELTFLLISMDPARDDPSRLREFAAEHQLDLKRWILITGNESDVLEISNVLNVRINKLENGGFDHSNIIHIINSKGNIVYQQVGLAVEPKESIEKIRALLQ